MHSFLKSQHRLHWELTSPVSATALLLPCLFWADVSRTSFVFRTTSTCLGPTSPFLAIWTAGNALIIVPGTFLHPSPLRTLLIWGFSTFLKRNVLLSCSVRLWNRLSPHPWKLGGVFEVAVAQRAGLLDIQPFLQTACVEEMAARRDHSGFHVLKGEQRYLLSTSYLKSLLTPPKVLVATYLFHKFPKENL